MITNDDRTTIMYVAWIAAYGRGIRFFSTVLCIAVSVYNGFTIQISHSVCVQTVDSTGCI